MKKESEKIPNLSIELARIATVLEKQNAWHRRFLLGLLQGAGTVLGATILAGTVLYGITSIAKQIPWTSVIQTAITQAVLNN